MMGRAEEAQASMRFRAKALLYCLGDPRLPDARLTRDQYRQPSPAFACAQRRISSSISSSRPTSGVVAVRRASKRLSTELGRKSRPSLHQLGYALEFFGSRGLSSSNRLPTSRRVLSAMTTMFGSAALCRRAAMFGVSPTMPRSCASPDPIKSPTTTSPVAMPTRVCSGARDFSPPTAWTTPAPPGPLARHHPHGLADSRSRRARRRPCTSPRSRRSAARSRQRTSGRPK